MDEIEAESIFFTHIEVFEKLFHLAFDLSQTNSYELPIRGEELIERARKLMKEFEQN